MPNTTLQTTTSILSAYVYHGQKACIWLYFDKRHDCHDQTKNHVVGYSIFVGCSSLPYDAHFYHPFMQIQLPYTIFGTHRAVKLRSQAEPKDDKADIHIHKDVASACPSLALVDADIHDTSARMSWSGGVFDFDINTNKKNIRYVKNLEPILDFRNKKNYTKKCNWDIELLHI